MNFNDFFRNVNIPVIICRDDEAMTVIYENRSAVMQFNPIAMNEDWKNADSGDGVSKVLRLNEDDFDTLRRLLAQSNVLAHFPASVTLYSGEHMPVAISANRFEAEGCALVKIVVYFMQDDVAPESYANAISTILNLAYKAKTTEEAINNVLSFTGNFIGVSRTFIFESTSETLTSNTYEWCAPGIIPQIDQLKDIPKEVYSYDSIIENGLAVTDDIRMLSPEDRAILESQGIKSLAIVPIFNNDEPLGYVGLDDCVNYRKWVPGEVQFLQSLSDLLASLIMRRDGERNVRYSLEILKTVTDNSDSLVLVADIYNDKILFVNSTFARLLGAAPEELLGQFSKVVLDMWAANSGGLDPLSKLIGQDGQLKSESYSWEFHNSTNNKWYLMRSSLIKWIDGRDVYLETATEITGQKEYEAQLEHVASTDRMTGLFNRERGMQIIQQILDTDTIENNSLVFIDLNGLKIINDTFGHAAGDHMILKTIELITNHIRKSDTLFRWGGDEFVLLIRADLAQTEQIMQKISTYIDEYNSTGLDEVTLGFSYGIVSMDPGSGHTAASIIEEADQKMYAQKVAIYKQRKK